MSQSGNRLATETATGGLPFVVDTISWHLSAILIGSLYLGRQHTITYTQVAIMCAAIKDTLSIAGVERGLLLVLYFQDRWGNDRSDVGERLPAANQSFPPRAPRRDQDQNEHGAAWSAV
jgi:hypothetical protein